MISAVRVRGQGHRPTSSRLVSSMATMLIVRGRGPGSAETRVPVQYPKLHLLDEGRLRDQRRLEDEAQEAEGDGQADQGPAARGVEACSGAWGFARAVVGVVFAGARS
jgi:hypothetical protein